MFFRKKEEQITEAKVIDEAFNRMKDTKDEAMHIIKLTETSARFLKLYELREKQIKKVLTENGNDWLAYGRYIQENDTPDMISIYEVSAIYTTIISKCFNEDKELEYAKENGVEFLYRLGKAYVTVYYHVAIIASCRFLTLYKFRGFKETQTDINEVIEYSPTLITIMSVNMALSYMNNSVKKYLDKTDDIVFTDKEQRYFDTLKAEYYPFGIDTVISINTRQTEALSEERAEKIKNNQD